MGTKGFEPAWSGHTGGRRGNRREHQRVAREQLPGTGTRGRARRAASGATGTTDDGAYLVICWRGKQRSCRAFATLAEARKATAQHVYDAADAVTEDGQAPADYGFRAAADWALELALQPDRTAARDLLDGTRIRVRLISADTARCLR
jgi:hypothetical protein